MLHPKFSIAGTLKISIMHILYHKLRNMNENLEDQQQKNFENLEFSNEELSGRK